MSSTYSTINDKERIAALGPLTKMYVSDTSFPHILISFMNRLAMDISSLVSRELDMLSLLNWRATCRTTYISAAGTLRRSLKGLVRRFNPFPHELLRLTTECRALLGGECALAFLLRDPHFQPMSLDIFVNNRYFQTLVEHLLFSPLVSMHMTFEGIFTVESRFSRHRDIHRYAIIRSSPNHLCKL